MTTKRRSTVNRLTRSDRLYKRLRNIESVSGFKIKGAEYTAQVFARAPVEIPGYLIQETEYSVTLRHKRTNASKRTVVSRFNIEDVVEVFGAVGEISSVTVMRDTLVREVVGTIVSETASAVVLRTATDETVKLIRNASTRLELVASDDEPAAAGKKKGKKAKPEKAVKTTKRKKRAADEDEDDLDD